MDNEKTLLGTQTKIKVKISGDGARMTRLTNFIIISFSILNAEDTVMSSKGAQFLMVSVNSGYDLNVLFVYHSMPCLPL